MCLHGQVFFLKGAVVILIRFIVLSIFLTSLPVAIAQHVEPAASAIGEELQVFPGEKFYVEGEREEVPVLELSSTFEGRMPGAMRIPFSFAVDSRRLLFKRRDRDWDYFAASEGQGRAWHGMVGNVMAPGDTVGIRMNRRTGQREWFVDNSRHNGMSTIWHRQVSEKDVTVHVVGKQMVLLEGARLRVLEYLGVRDNQLRVRYTEFGGAKRSEEFLFPVNWRNPVADRCHGASCRSARRYWRLGSDKDHSWV